MMKYICKKSFVIDLFDDDGFDREEQLTIKTGEVFDKIETRFRIVGGDETVRLENDLGIWMELLPETIAEHFEEVKNKA